MLEFDSLQTAIKLNQPITLKKKWLWNRLNYCPTNCTKFLFKILPTTQTNLSLILKKWYLNAGFWFSSNCYKTQPTNDFLEEMVVEPRSIIVQQIVLSFFSRSILATQSNLCFILNKWYLNAGFWFSSNCHKTQPANDFLEEMVMEPPSIIMPQIVPSFFTWSILAT